jgi:hypothetical protein
MLSLENQIYKCLKSSQTELHRPWIEPPCWHSAQEDVPLEVPLHVTYIKRLHSKSQCVKRLTLQEASLIWSPDIYVAALQHILVHR